MVYYMAGVTMSVAVFPKAVGVLSVLYLALGDPFASTIGIKYVSVYVQNDLIVDAFMG